MDEQYWTHEPNPSRREEDTYQTGRTHPPKNHGGLIAVLLVAIILLGGIVSAMSILNIRLSRQLRSQNDPSNPMSFYSTENTTATTGETLPTQQPEIDETDWSLDLNHSPQSVENIPQEGGLSLQQIYQNTIDSVVSIVCTLNSGSTASGTGVVLSSDGYILTNCHVVDGAKQVDVLFSNEQTLPATLVGSDTVSDLAVLHVQAADLSAAQFGDSSALRVGDMVAAIGDPLGVELRGTMTNGIVSAINRDLTLSGRTMTLIQTNAALNSGNSGGPLLNCYGQVIGINTMKIGDYMNSSSVEGLGFAIPSTTVKEVVEQLLRQGYVSGRPSFGFEGEAISIFHQVYSHLPKGIYITKILPGSYAEAKGLSVGDIILAIDNVRITDMDTLTNVLYSHQPGDVANVIVYRSGQQYALELTVGEAE